MPKAIEIRWPRNGESGTDSYVNYRSGVTITEAMIAEMIGVATEVVEAYLDRLERETDYEVIKGWVTRKNLTRKERLLRDEEFLLAALALGNVVMKFDAADKILSLLRTEDRTGYLTTFEITPEELAHLVERWEQIGFKGQSGKDHLQSRGRADLFVPESDQ